MPNEEQERTPEDVIYEEIPPIEFTTAIDPNFVPFIRIKSGTAIIILHARDAQDFAVKTLLQAVRAESDAQVVRTAAVELALGKDVSTKLLQTIRDNRDNADAEYELMKANEVNQRLQEKESNNAG